MSEAVIILVNNFSLSSALLQYAKDEKKKMTNDFNLVDLSLLILITQV